MLRENAADDRDRLGDLGTGDSQRWCEPQRGRRHRVDDDTGGETRTRQSGGVVTRCELCGEEEPEAAHGNDLRKRLERGRQMRAGGVRKGGRVDGQHLSEHRA